MDIEARVKGWLKLINEFPIDYIAEQICLLKAGDNPNEYEAKPSENPMDNIKAIKWKGVEEMANKFKQGICDLFLGEDDPRTAYDEDACDKFRQKDKQVVDPYLTQTCLKVCGNCRYFTVAEYTHLSGSIGKGGTIERSG